MADQPTGNAPTGQWNQPPPTRAPAQNTGIPEQSQFSQQGMKVDVTPQRPIQPARQRPGAQGPRQIPKRGIIILAAIIIIAAAGFIIVPHLLSTPPTTVATTTIPVSNVSSLSSCQSINRPGSYYLSGSIKAQNMSGACVTINANNVSLICNQDHITGRGPYGNTTPYSYGILVNGTGHDTVSSCVVGSFSYGIYARGATHLVIADNNVSPNAMSDVYLNASPGATVNNNYLSGASSTQGALDLAAGSAGASVYNNTIINNVRTGIYVDSIGNNFVKNYINDTPLSFECSVSAGFQNDSHALSNTCDNNKGCDFVKCNIENIPLNFSQITLGSQVRTCGSINSPGVYSLENALSLSDYAPKLSQNYTVPCITVNASRVTLECNGFPISGAQVGISAASVKNLTIEGCHVLGSGIGMRLDSVNFSTVSNSVFLNGSVGLSLAYSDNNQFSNITAAGLGHGIYMLNSTLNSFDGFNASGNGYGIYVNSSLGNVFNKGVAQNNSRMDVYATNDSVNASYNLMQATSCGLTDALWAPCAQYVLPSLKFYPINSCQVIRRAGNYTLTSGIVTSDLRCFDIRASDVRLSCAGFTVTQLSHSSNSTAVLAYNDTNVTVSNCAFYYFRQGVSFINSTEVSMLNSTVQYAGTGAALSNIFNATLAGDRISGSTAAGIYMKRVYFGNVHSNNVSAGRPTGVGIVLNGSAFTGIRSNYISGDYAGVSLINSTNNTVQNNTAQLSLTYDYQCDARSGSLASNMGGINYGASKSGCRWIAAVEPSMTSTCTAFLTPTTYDMGSDMVYPSANLCFGVYANATTINCMGHTVIATDGGSFVLFKNAKSGIVENCNLKGFSPAIQSFNSTVRVVNNTIYSNASSPSTAAAIGVQGTASFYVLGNNVTTKSAGISISNSTGGQLENNWVRSVSTAYGMDNVTGTTERGNYGSSSAAYGLSLSASTADTFTDNIFDGLQAGILCLAGSTNSSSEFDGGHNTCSSAPACQWLSGSSSTC